MAIAGLHKVARVSPVGLAKLANPRWIYAPHLQEVHFYLMAVASGLIGKLMVFMPPQHGKTEMITHYFSTWFLIDNPKGKVILASYDGTQAEGWGMKNRDLFSEFAPALAGVSLSSRFQAGRDWETSEGGRMYSTGVGGPMTGRGANLLIIDDPIKNPEESFSKTMRDKIFDWYQAVAYTRLSEKGAVIIVQTRWHEDDLCGRLLQAESDWTVLSLPAIAEKDEEYQFLKRKKGDALFPQKFPLEKLEEIKKTLSSYWWSALYQQRPAPISGNLFKREQFRYFEEDEDFFYLPAPVRKEDCINFLGVDLATSLKGDYSVICHAFQTLDGDLLVWDMHRIKVEAYKFLEKIKEVLTRPPFPAFAVIEATGFQLSFVQMALRDGFPAIPVRPERDKVARAMGLVAKMEAGKVYFKKNAPWLKALEEELLFFPTGTYDDQVDALVYASLGYRPVEYGKPIYD